MVQNSSYFQAENKIKTALRLGATELDLSNMDIFELPESLNRFTNLISLNLSHNRLGLNSKQLSKLTALKNLQSLDLSFNELTGLQNSLDQIGNFTQLLFLNLSYNLILTLPDSIKQLAELRSLNLAWNRLTVLPEELGQLIHLQQLNLEYNQLVKLPLSFGELRELQELYIHENTLHLLPESFIQLSNLKKLDASRNYLEALPDSFGRLNQLEEIDFQVNLISSLPESFGQLTNLQKLNFSSNKLRVLPDTFRRLNHIKHLNLANNQLKTLPESFEDLVQLTELNLANNNLYALPESIGHLTQLQELNLSNNNIEALPESFGHITQLQKLYLTHNKLELLPESLEQLDRLKILHLSDNKLNFLQETLGKLIQLEELSLHQNQIESLPESFSNLTLLKKLSISNNKLTDLPYYLIRLHNLDQNFYHNIFGNPFNPELYEACNQGTFSVKAYLRAKSEKVVINEAKLILVGEGEVGKSCLLGAMRDEEWKDSLPTTHGIEIKPVILINPDTNKKITLNGWDFGGQRVYRPTHQLFFSAPAVYLVVWKPREGPQQGFVKEWIQLVQRRAPSAKILVVATHGGPQQRQPDIDRQELWDLFGKDTIVGFFFVDSKPDEQGKRKGITELKEAIFRVAVELPEVGRSVPKSFAEVRAALQAKGVPYLPLDDVLNICRTHNMDDEIARLFITISHRLGHLTHYENDPALRDIVILRPDWLATAMSYVLDDEITRTNHGIVSFERLIYLWDDPQRDTGNRYSSELYLMFLRLMERFDISYKVALPTEAQDAISFWQQLRDVLENVSKRTVIASKFHYTSLIGQLVPDNRPEKDLERVWLPSPNQGDLEQTQICRIVDEKVFLRLLKGCSTN